MALLVSGGLLAGTAEAAPAGDPPGGSVKYQRKNPVCANNGDSVTVGGAVFMQELGKQGVTGLRVEWLLYDVNPYDHPVVSAKRRKTINSSSFPNDARSFLLNASQTSQTWTVGPASDEGWWLIAKMTWVRNNKRDWNDKLPVTRCG